MCPERWKSSLVLHPGEIFTSSPFEAIGLPKCQVCTHCFDGSSAYTLDEFADED